MNESEYISALYACWPCESETTPEAIALADDAVRAFPDSPKLWCMRGDLIQLAAASCPYSLDDAGACYLRAIAVDPSSVEAHEGAAHFYDVVMSDEQRAASYFAEFQGLRPASSSANVLFPMISIIVDDGH
ncbi:MAG: hypothetical protein ABJF10_26195 [Chthoniobacter sp.]|uniref:hypothetical protein n=1 Tax=Chthoniobacter sp. TaxID=2510640 RepID=UPI0032A7995F